MGRVVSFCFHCPGARSVTLQGTSTAGMCRPHPMIYDGIQDLWTITLPLEPGRYEYTCYVDGHVWWNDLFTPKAPNVWGSENSYRDVT